MEEKEAGDARARYVWDRDKLAWVEAKEQPAADERPIEPVAQERVEEYPEGAEAEGAYPVEAEAEEEVFQYRGFWSRLGAILIDGVIIGIIQFIVITAIGADSPISRWVSPIIGAAYFIGPWALRGQTLGKIAVGAKIVKLDGSPIGWGRAVLRYIVYLAYLLIVSLTGGATYTLFIVIFVALFIIALNKKKRGLHDFVAGTIVINSRPRVLEDYEEEEEYEEDYEAEDEAES
jgi:uncharacterized RDD family membrane protein YckC